MPLSDLDLEPFPLDLEQGQYSLPGDEPMPGGVPDLDDIDQLGLDDNLPGREPILPPVAFTTRDDDHKSLLSSMSRPGDAARDCSL